MSAPFIRWTQCLKRTIFQLTYELWPAPIAYVVFRSHIRPIYFVLFSRLLRFFVKSACVLFRKRFYYIIIALNWPTSYLRFCVCLFVCLSRLHRTSSECVGHDLPPVTVTSSLSESQRFSTGSRRRLTSDWCNLAPTAATDVVCSPSSMGGGSSVQCSCTVSVYSDDVDVSRSDIAASGLRPCCVSERTALSHSDWLTSISPASGPGRTSLHCAEMTNFSASGMNRRPEINSLSSLYVVGN